MCVCVFFSATHAKTPARRKSVSPTKDFNHTTPKDTHKCSLPPAHKTHGAMHSVTIVFVTCCVALTFLGRLSSAKTVPVTTKTLDTRACLPPHDKYPFCNVSQPIDARVHNLISLLNDEEKPPLLTAREGGGGSPGPPGNVSRLGLPEYDWGVSKSVLFCFCLLLVAKYPPRVRARYKTRLILPFFSYFKTTQMYTRISRAIRIES